MSESSLLPLLRQRRSIRHFLPKPVERDKIDLLVEAVLRAPSSRGRNPWEFIVVTDPELLRQLSLAKSHGSSFLANAPMAVVIAADPETCDVWVEDCSIAAIILQLTAESLGLGSCWAQIRLRPHGEGRTAEDHVKGLLHMPGHLLVEAIIGIGYPGENKPGHRKEDLPHGKIHHNRYLAAVDS